MTERKDIVRNVARAATGAALLLGPQLAPQLAGIANAGTLKDCAISSARKYDQFHMVGNQVVGDLNHNGKADPGDTVDQFVEYTLMCSDGSIVLKQNPIGSTVIPGAPNGSAESTGTVTTAPAQSGTGVASSQEPCVYVGDEGSFPPGTENRQIVVQAGETERVEAWDPNNPFNTPSRMKEALIHGPQTVNVTKPGHQWRFRCSDAEIIAQAGKGLTFIAESDANFIQVVNGQATTTVETTASTTNVSSGEGCVYVGDEGSFNPGNSDRAVTIAPQEEVRIEAWDGSNPQTVETVVFGPQTVEAKKPGHQWRFRNCSADQIKSQAGNGLTWVDPSQAGVSKR